VKWKINSSFTDAELASKSEMQLIKGFECMRGWFGA